MGTIGKLNSFQGEHRVEWKIPNYFFSLSVEDGEHYDSDTFSFCGELWYLTVYPNGLKEKDSIGYVDLYLAREASGNEINQDFSFSLKNSDGKKEKEKHITYAFKEAVIGCGYNCIISRSELLRRKFELMPDNALTVVCCLKYREPIRDTDGSSSAECSYCKVSFKIEDIATHKKWCLEKEMKCPKCCENVASREWLDHKCVMERAEAIEKLLSDLKRVMLSGDHSDMTVKVKEEEFRLHRSILGARNPFFDSRLKREVRETTLDTVSIINCEPSQFRKLIHYIYTGTIDNLCPENVCDIYEVALEYQEEQMKSECLQFMINTISVSNFCDYTALALRNDEKELLKTATELFTCKVKEITSNSKWKTFLETYPLQVDELYMKTLDQYDKK